MEGTNRQATYIWTKSIPAHTASPLITERTIIVPTKSNASRVSPIATLGGNRYSCCIRKVHVDGQSVRLASLDHYNARGDVIAKSTADPTADVTWMAAYLAFGTRPQEKGTNPDPHRANTKEEDGTGLLNEGHRYRCLETGSFITRDPAGFVDGPNLYTYVRQNPWGAFDAHGLEESPLEKPLDSNKDASKIYANYTQGRKVMASTAFGKKMDSAMTDSQQRVAWRMDPTSASRASTSKGVAGPVVNLTTSTTVETVVHEAGHAVEQLATQKASGPLTPKQEAAVKSAKEIVAMVSDDRDTQVIDNKGTPQPGVSIELRAQRIRNIVGTEATLSKIEDPAERQQVLSNVKSALNADMIYGEQFKKLGPQEQNIIRNMQHSYNDNDRYYKLPRGSQLGNYPAPELAKAPQPKEKK